MCQRSPSTLIGSVSFWLRFEDLFQSLPHPSWLTTSGVLGLQPLAPTPPWMTLALPVKPALLNLLSTLGLLPSSLRIRYAHSHRIVAIVSDDEI